MKIVVVDYRPQWPAKFLEEAELLSSVFGNNLLQIFHIGSTSVPGLKAKAIIDMMPVVRDIQAVDSRRIEFEKSGYEYMGEFGMPGRRYMRKGGDARTHQIHAFQYDNANDITRHLAFRDYLRSHAEICDVYGGIKSKLAAQYPSDIEAYSLGKNEFVQQVERDALQWHWKRYS